MTTTTAPIAPDYQKKIEWLPLILRTVILFLLFFVPALLLAYRLTLKAIPAVTMLFPGREHMRIDNATLSPIAAFTRMTDTNQTSSPAAELTIDAHDFVQTLPDSIGDLTSLTSLTIRDQPIRELPSSIGNLENLKTLIITNAPLTRLPDSIGNLTHLTDLEIVGTDITSLPDTIGNLTNLERIDAPHNKLTSVPDAISNLPKLNEVDFSDNPLTVIPKFPESIYFIYLAQTKIPQKDLKALDDVKGIFY